MASSPSIWLLKPMGVSSGLRFRLHCDHLRSPCFVDDGFVAAHRQTDQALRVGVGVAMVDDNLRGERGRHSKARTRKGELQISVQFE